MCPVDLFGAGNSQRVNHHENPIKPPFSYGFPMVLSKLRFVSLLRLRGYAPGSPTLKAMVQPGSANLADRIGMVCGAKLTYDLNILKLVSKWIIYG